MAEHIGVITFEFYNIMGSKHIISTGNIGRLAITMLGHFHLVIVALSKGHVHVSKYILVIVRGRVLMLV